MPRPVRKPQSELIEGINRVLREKKDLTPRKWSVLATGKPDTVRQILTGRSKNPRIDTIRALEEVAGQRLLLIAEGASEAESFRRFSSDEDADHVLSLVGYVGAGDQVYHFGLGETRIRVPAPPGVRRGLAAEVRGESMLPVYRPGDLLVATEYLGPVGSLVGKDCFVQVVEGPLYVKILRKGKGDRFNLESYNHHEIIAGQMIEWAAPVVWVKRAL